MVSCLSLRKRECLYGQLSQLKEEGVSLWSLISAYSKGSVFMVSCLSLR